MRAPCSSAERAQPQTSFHGSSAASGTRNARRMSGLTRGSRRSASATGISSAGTPVALQPSRNWSPYSGSSHGVETNSPPVSSTQSAAVTTEDPVLGDALAGGRRILDRVAAARVEEAVKSTGGPVGEITALHQDGGEATQRGVPRRRRLSSRPDDEDVASSELIESPPPSAPTVSDRSPGPRRVALADSDGRFLALGEAAFVSGLAAPRRCESPSSSSLG